VKNATFRVKANGSIIALTILALLLFIDLKMVDLEQTTALPITPISLFKEGEMSRLINVKNWGATTIGQQAIWPQSLVTTLSIMLGSKLPMLLWWGPKLLCF